MKRCHCGGRMLVYASKTQGLRRTRYRRCESCGDTQKQIVTLAADGHPQDEKTGLLAASTDIMDCPECGRTMAATSKQFHNYEDTTMSATAQWKAEVRKYCAMY